jgi:hypothetical protein
VLDYLQHCAQRDHRILREFCVTQCCFVVLGGAKLRKYSVNPPAGDRLKRRALDTIFPMRYCALHGRVAGDGLESEHRA